MRSISRWSRQVFQLQEVEAVVVLVVVQVVEIGFPRQESWWWKWRWWWNQDLGGGEMQNRGGIGGD